MKTNGTRPREVLSRPNTFRVADWIRSNWKLLEQEKFTYEQILSRIKDETTISIKSECLRRLCLDLGLNLSEVLSRPSRLTNKSGTALRKVMTQLRATQLQLKDLCDSLGHTFNADGTMDPEWLKLMAGGKIRVDASQKSK